MKNSHFRQNERKSCEHAQHRQLRRAGAPYTPRPRCLPRHDLGKTEGEGDDPGKERGGEDSGEESCRFSEKEAFDFGGKRVRLKETDCDSEGHEEQA